MHWYIGFMRWSSAAVCQVALMVEDERARATPFKMNEKSDNKEIVNEAINKSGNVCQMMLQNGRREWTCDHLPLMPVISIDISARAENRINI